MSSPPLNWVHQGTNASVSSDFATHLSEIYVSYLSDDGMYHENNGFRFTRLAENTIQYTNLADGTQDTFYVRREEPDRVFERASPEPHGRRTRQRTRQPSVGSEEEGLDETYFRRESMDYDDVGSTTSARDTRGLVTTTLPSHTAIFNEQARSIINSAGGIMSNMVQFMNSVDMKPDVYAIQNGASYTSMGFSLKLSPTGGLDINMGRQVGHHVRYSHSSGSLR